MQQTIEQEMFQPLKITVSTDLVYIEQGDDTFVLERRKCPAFTKAINAQPVTEEQP